MSKSMGRFVWHELLTTDTEGAKAFYSEVIGWTTTAFSGSDYQIWMVGEMSAGGLMKLPAEAREAGAPTHWMGYVEVGDVDASARQAVELGGKILMPAADIPDVGRFAIIADPQGATLALFRSTKPGEPAKWADPGHLGWAELNTTDWKSAWKFYSTMFGWKPTRSMEMGEEFGEYFMFGTDSKDSMGGMSNAAKVMHAPAHWLHYIQVGDIDAAVKTIAKKGGKVLNGPMEVPGGDRVAQCQDPQGGFFGIAWSPER